MKVKLTALTAQAGYGKTTLLSLWASQNKHHVAWVSLDPFDNDLVHFWRYVMEAIRLTNASVLENASKYLSAIGQETYKLFLEAFLNDLDSITEKIVLVLDDFHEIVHPLIYESVTFMLQYLPPHIHIYIASRTALPFPVARLNAKGEMNTITEQQLRFRIEDGVHFFRDCMQIELSHEEAAMFVQQTEGWVSGLHLAALSLKKSEEPTNFIQDFSGQQQDIAQYLLEEIFERQTDQVKSFLLQTSILSRMNASLCEAITGNVDANAFLEDLARQRLFVTRIDERGEWYRYHQLFADFLQQQARTKQPKQMEELHYKSARWWEAQGYLDEAIYYWKGCGRFEEMAQLIEKRLPDLLNYRNSVLQWLDAIPDEIIRNKPALQLLHIKLMSESGHYKWADNKLRGLENQLSDPNWESWIGVYYFISWETAGYCRDLTRMDKYLTLIDAYESQSSENPIQMIAGNSLSGIGFESILSFFNNLHDADRILTKCIRIWERKEDYPFLGYFYGMYSDLMYEWDRTDEAMELMNRVLQNRVWHPYTRIRFYATTRLAFYYFMKGQTTYAFSLLDQVKDKLDTPDKHLFQLRLDAERAYLSVYSGRTDGVLEWVESCGLKYTDDVPSRYREYYILARAYMEIGQIDEALQLLEKLYLLTHEKDWIWDQIKVLILQCIAFHRADKHEVALLKLETALHLAEQSGYIRSFVDEGRALGDLIVRYVQYRKNKRTRLPIPVSIVYVKKLLRKMDVQLDEGMEIPSLLTDQETRVLQLIELGYKNREIAEQIHVSSETVKQHLKNIFQKLEVNSRVQAIKVAKELDII